MPNKYFFKNPYFILTAITLLFLSPYFVLGPDAHFPLLDNLDSYIIWNKIIADRGLAFANANTIVPGFMEGVPKFSLIGGPSLFLTLMLLFPAYWAVVAHLTIIHFIAVFGMYSLCKNYISKHNNVIAITVALGFGLQYFLQAFSLGIAAIPLLAFVFLKIYNRQANALHWVALVLYPFASNLQSVGFYVLTVWGCACVILMWRHKKIYAQLWLANAMMFIVFIALRFDLLKNLLGKQSFVSHRTETLHFASKNSFRFVINSVREKFLADNTLYIVIICSLLALGYAICRKHRYKGWLYALVGAVLLLCVFITVIKIPAINAFRNQHYFLRIYSLERPFIFVSLFWYLAWGFALVILFGAKGRRLLILLCIAQLVILFWVNAAWQNILGGTFNNRSRSFTGYYSTDLFDSIKAAIALPLNTYKVGSLGINPAAAQYNGLFTIDGICTNYPIIYKHGFKKIITTELALINLKQGAVQYGFQNWGHECYLNTKDLYKIIKAEPVDKLHPAQIDSIHWDMEAFKALGGRFLISSVTINAPQAAGLTLLKTFENKYYKLGLYQIK